MTMIFVIMVLLLISFIVKSVVGIIRFIINLLPFVMIYVLAKKYIFSER